MIKIYGASDDLIEIEGDIREEFYVLETDEKDKCYLAFSDGTLLSVVYDGCWRFTPIYLGTSSYDNKQAISADDEQYSDIVTLDGDINWVAQASNFAKRV